MPKPDASSQTLAYYEANADGFWEGTKDHDVTQNIQALLGHVVGKPPFAILDFGCGPGRDLQAFRELGHKAFGLEGCIKFAAMARENQCVPPTPTPAPPGRTAACPLPDPRRQVDHRIEGRRAFTPVKGS